MVPFFNGPPGGAPCRRNRRKTGSGGLISGVTFVPPHSCDRFLIKWEESTVDRRADLAYQGEPSAELHNAMSYYVASSGSFGFPRLPVSLWNHYPRSRTTSSCLGHLQAHLNPRRTRSRMPLLQTHPLSLQVQLPNIGVTGQAVTSSPFSHGY